MKNYIFFLFYIIFNPWLIKLFFKNIYLPAYPQFSWLKKYNIKTVIDIGAYHGNMSKIFSYLFPDATIYAFEPNPKEYQRMKRSCTFNNFFAINSAISDKTGGTTSFYVCDYSPASSLLPPTTVYKQKAKNINKLKKIIVATTTLDAYFSDKSLRKHTLIKIDTQGSEKLVLEGGKEVLKQASIVHIETSFIKLYKNQCLFNDVYNILTHAGYRYIGSINESHFYPYFYPPDQENSIFIKE